MAAAVAGRTKTPGTSQHGHRRRTDGGVGETHSILESNVRNICVAMTAVNGTYNCCFLWQNVSRSSATFNGDEYGSAGNSTGLEKQSVTL